VAGSVVITIDGPSGVGKGTIGLRLAAQLGLHFLDSGALYRLTGLAARRAGLDLVDEAAIAAKARQLDIQFVAQQGELQVLLQGENVTSAIRTETAGKDASCVAAHPAVRDALLQFQRDFAKPPGLVADGRDMGTTVFPSATCKIFLTATPEVRAQRRFGQLKDKGANVTFSELVREISDRDARDMARAASPLRPADDSYTIDTSELSVDEVFAEVYRFCQPLLVVAKAHDGDELP
jgi:CMP/dCMP kinase